MNQITEQAVLDKLTNIIDPDLHKDIVTLGFVKDLAITGGEVSFRIDGEYFPNATMQDFQTRVNRSLIMIARQSGLVVGPFDGAV